MPDYVQMLNDIYAGLGVAATIDASGSVDLTVLDKTQGVVLDNGHGGQVFAAAKPAACVRFSELEEKGISRQDLRGLTLTLNGKDWKIVSTQPKPKPGIKGEVYLILQTP